MAKDFIIVKENGKLSVEFYSSKGEVCEIVLFRDVQELGEFLKQIKL